MPKQTLGDMLGDSPKGESEIVDEVAVADPPAPAPQYQTDIHFEPSETITPRLVIAQGLSPEVRNRKAEEGDFLLAGFEPRKSVTVVLAGYSKQRRFVEQGANRARCWSPDAVQGFGNPGIKCEECPFSKWTDSGRKDDAGRTINLRPPCDEVDSFVAFSVSHGMPCVWNLKGSAIKTSRLIKTWANGLGLQNFAVEITSVARSKDIRTWYEPSVEIMTGITPEECQKYAQMALGAVNVAGALEAGGADA